ncbi:MAG: NAD(+)--rifampin ADP-ribosyltransferase [Actinomycetia bacterium]|nr:NAD(+)--rifampin ADP-ribosyltransferase [Actinomycetes bacterium]
MGDVRWNSSLHAFERLLRQVPAGAATGLDVGCGEGETARRLRTRVNSVVGIDPDADSIDLARSHDDDIDYLVTTLDSLDLGGATFDVVTAVAVMHHLDQRSAIPRLASLVRPGGLLLIVGIARSRTVADFARDAIDSVGIRRHTLFKRVWNTSAPKVWPPPLSYAQSRSLSLQLLDGARYGRVPYFRYALTWRRPSDTACGRAERRGAALLLASRAMSTMPEPVPFEVYEPGVYLHGTKADLAVGEMLIAGRESNFEQGRVMNFVYFTATLDAATWGAELAAGEGRGRIYVVEPMGEFEDDPNVTDKKFPGNPTQSFRSREPLRVVRELVDWTGHSPEKLQGMRNAIERIGAGKIED